MPCGVCIPVNTQPVRFQALFLCVLSFKDNFEMNNEIKDVTKIFEAPEHILLIQFWGLRRPHVLLLIFVSLSSELQKTPEILPIPIPFSLEADIWAPASLFLFLLWFFLKQPCRDLPAAQAAHIHAYSYSLHSKM